MNDTAEKIDEQDKASILRTTGLEVRDRLETYHTGEQAVGHDDAQEAALEHLRTLRGFEYIARDIYANGVRPAFSTLDYFYERFVHGMPGLEGDTELGNRHEKASLSFR